MKPKISVVIPTHNRKELLKKAIMAFSNQDTPKKDFEIILVDDASTDGTQVMVKKIMKKVRLNLRYYKQKKLGVSVARNTAIKKAKSDLILLTDDDMEPSKSFLREHINYHKKYPNVAVLGLNLWSKDIEITDFMKYIAPNGPVFDYGSIKNEKDCGYGPFYSSNISLEKKWFKKELFDEDLPKEYVSVEDTELGYRLSKRGLKIVLNRKAITYHHHAFTEEKLFNKARMVGKVNVVYFFKKHPELKSLTRLRLVTKVMLVLLKPINLYKDILLAINNKVLYWKLKFLRVHYEGVREGLILEKKW